MWNQTKNNLRERILTLLRDQEEEDRLRKSRRIEEQLFKLPEFKNAKTILFYASCKGEVETFEMICKSQEIGKAIALPAIYEKIHGIVPVRVESLRHDLEVGPYGIQQPKWDPSRALEAAKLDMVIVPGLAFDRQRNRLGRGGGYYDRFLGGLPGKVFTVGLAFDFQMVDRFPFQEGHDVPVSKVLTNDSPSQKN